jgi:hypothetical protein
VRQARKAKPGRKSKSKAAEKPLLAREKENKSARAAEDVPRFFQPSLARRVPMPDPLTGAVVVEEVPPGVESIKMV